MAQKTVDFEVEWRRVKRLLGPYTDEALLIQEFHGAVLSRAEAWIVDRSSTQ